MLSLLRPAMLLASLMLVSASAQSLRDLTDVQAAVQEVLPKVTDAVVAVESDKGTASGVIVSADGLILTAAHVATLQESGPRLLTVRFNDGRVAQAKALGADVPADAAMLRLVGKPQEWPHVKLAGPHHFAAAGDWCFALGHPAGFDAHRGPVLRVGRLIKAAPNKLQSDCVLMGGDSGGGLFSLAGELIGIHSQIWEGRDQNMHCALAPFQRSWDAMMAGQIVREWEQGNGVWLGVLTDEAAVESVRITDVAAGSPAQLAGLAVGDEIVMLDEEPVSTRQAFTAAVKARAIGQTISLTLRSEKGPRRVEVKLGKRPKEP